MSAPNQAWVSDLTYIRTDEGFLYAALITDVASRKIVGAHIGDSLEAEGCLAALEQALADLRAEPGLRDADILLLQEMDETGVEAIAQACPDRLEALVFGVADYAASTQARTTRMGGANEEYFVLGDPDEAGARSRYLGNQWHFPMSRMIVACRAYGLRPIDGPFGDINDPDGYIAHAQAFAALGGEGKWAIHPSQIELAHQVFTPSDAEVTQARRILDAMREAAVQGKGAVTLDGAMIDAASIKQAEVLINKMEQIAGRAA